MAADPEAIYEALAGGVGRSPAYRWLRDHHDAIAAALARCSSRPDWDALAKLAQLDGVTDGRRKPPSGRTMRVQWGILRGDLLADGELEPKPAPASKLTAESRQSYVASTSQSDSFARSLEQRKLRRARPL